jgi:hypothetical protein
MCLIRHDEFYAKLRLHRFLYKMIYFIAKVLRFVLFPYMEAGWRIEIRYAVGYSGVSSRYV